jgi:protein CpxP
MKKLLMICGLLFGVITLTHAQDGGRKMMSPEDRAKKSTERLAEKLKLTEDQKAKVLAIYTEEATSMSKNMQQDNTDRKAKREEMKAARVANEAKIEAVLTNDQKKAYEAMKAERKAAMEKRGANMGDRADKKL